MKPGDMVYYLYTDKHGTDIKFAASILACNDDSYLIRVGRLDVHAQKIVTFESTVNSEKLLPRSTPCSYENDLTDTN